MTISVIISATNEEEFLPGCLASVKFADEVILIDGGSKDATVKIAESTGAKVIVNKWSGFANQKNFGAQLAKGDWLLFVDADERVDRELAKEIRRINDSKTTLFEIPRLNYILGKPLYHGGWYPDYQQRLVRRENFLGWQGELHEHIQVQPLRIKRLNHHLIHLTHRGIDWMLDKTRKYALIEAQQYFKANHAPVRWTHFLGGIGHEIWDRGIVNRGYKDGLRGWIEIFFQAFNAFIIKVYLWELQQPKSLNEQYRELRRNLDNEF